MSLYQDSPMTSDCINLWSKNERILRCFQRNFSPSRTNRPKRKSLKDPDLGFALLTSLQIGEAVYLTLDMVRTADIEEAQARIKAPMETPYESIVNFNAYILTDTPW